MRKLGVLLIALAMGLSVVFIAGDFNISESSTNHQVECDDGEGFQVSGGLVSQWPNTDFCNYIYQSDNGFLSGGVARDGIPPIYEQGYVYPERIPFLGGKEPSNIVAYETIESANEWLVPQHPVIAFEIDGDARAYPLGILTRHEIANTEVGGKKVAVTFCPLCNTGVVFDRELDDQILTFGVSGFLRFSDMVMWDHETESWWQQSTGEGLVGELAGEQLTFITSSMTSYEQFREQYPEGQVLSANGRNYNRNPYVNYDSTSSPFLYNGPIDERLEATERVLGYRHRTDDGNQIYTAYSFATLEETIVANDVVDGEARVAFWQPGALSALDAGNIDESREVGAANLFDPTLEDGTVLTFEADGTTIRDVETGSTWNLFGIATDGELEGTQLRQINAVTHFWFAWQAFHFTEVWELGTTTDELRAE